MLYYETIHPDTLELLKRYSFDELIEFYLAKYSDAQLFTVLKSLTYYEDEEMDPLPLMIESASWDEINPVIVATVN